MQKQKKQKNLLELRNIDKFIRYKINIQKLITFLYFDNKQVKLEKTLL